MKNEPAFPVEGLGLSKREYFAAMAMQGLLSAIYSDKKMIDEFCQVKYISRPQGVGESEFITGCEAISSNAVSYADALIEKLSEGEDE